MEYELTAISLRQYMSKEVIDNAGNVCGTIKDFLISRNTYKAIYILLSEGGLMGLDLEQTYIVAPITELNLDNPEGAQVSMNISCRAIKDSPRFSDKKLKEEGEDLIKSIEQYYGIQNEVQTTGTFSKKSGAHQSVEGSSQVSENEPADNSKISEEVDYDKIKGNKA